MRARATDPLILNFSQRMALVTQRILGTSLSILSNCFSSRKTALLSLSLTLTLVHDFFLALAPFPPAAFYFASCALLAAPFAASLPLTYAFLAYKSNNHIKNCSHFQFLHFNRTCRPQTNVSKGFCEWEWFHHLPCSAINNNKLLR